MVCLVELHEQGEVFNTIFWVIVLLWNEVSCNGTLFQGGNLVNREELISSVILSYSNHLALFLSFFFCAVEVPIQLLFSPKCFVLGSSGQWVFLDGSNNRKWIGMLVSPV